jgi:glutamate-1-semialdehyde aminotransferase
MLIPITRIALFAGLVALSSLATADIYRCVDADGTTLYSDIPCARNAKANANITEEVGACTTAQCEEQRQQQAEEARRRVRAEKDELNDAVAKRRQTSADYERERILIEEQRSRRALEERLAAMADQAALATGTPYYDNPGYPIYPIVTRPCGRHCKPLPQPTVDVNKKRKEPSVRGRSRLDP